MATESVINVQSAGSTPVAAFSQIQGGTTVYIQQVANVDATTGTPAPVSANGMQVVPYSGTQRMSGVLSATSVGSFSNAALVGQSITNGKTATLQHATFCADKICRWDFLVIDNSGVPTTIMSIMTNPYETFDFKPNSFNEISSVLANNSGNAKFQINVSNFDPNTNSSANCYASIFWAEN